MSSILSLEEARARLYLENVFDLKRVYADASKKAAIELMDGTVIHTTCGSGNLTHLDVLIDGEVKLVSRNNVERCLEIVR